LLVLISTAGGVGLATTRPTLYTAEVRLAVGGTDLAAYAIPGFAAASRELASNYARYVTPGLVIDTLPNETSSKLVGLGASPVPASNVIRVEATATDARAASIAANKAGTVLVARLKTIIAEQSAETTLAAYNALTRQLSTARQVQATAQRRVNKLEAAATRAEQPAEEPGPALTEARKALVEAATKAGALKLRQDALGGLYQQQLSRGRNQNELIVVTPVQSTGDNRISRMQSYGLVGAGWGLSVSLCLVMLLDRRAARRRSADRRADPPNEVSLTSLGFGQGSEPEDLVDVRARLGSAEVDDTRSDADLDRPLPFPGRRQWRSTGDEGGYDAWSAQR
jgi:ribosomal protein L7/L12